MEDDNGAGLTETPPLRFNPRPPCGGRRNNHRAVALCLNVSIHVPRVEDDSGRGYYDDKKRQVSIHVPRVEDDPEQKKKPMTGTVFQSTSPVWRTTWNVIDELMNTLVSIHVPRVEDDYTLPRIDAESAGFNPRPPCGGRRP